MSEDRVIVKLKTDKVTGKFQIEVIGHEGNMHCSDELDAALIQDIMNMEIPGLELGLTDKDGGKTSEYYDEAAKAHKVKPVKMDDAPFPEEEEAFGGKKAKTPLGLGFGV